VKFLKILFLFRYCQENPSVMLFTKNPPFCLEYASISLIILSCQLHDAYGTSIFRSCILSHFLFFEDFPHSLLLSSGSSRPRLNPLNQLISSKKAAKVDSQGKVLLGWASTNTPHWLS
jgi:hypothetical protein